MLFFGILWCNRTAEAANKAWMSDGSIVFETVDTKASTNIRWVTAGFTIRKDRSYGNPLKDGEYAQIYFHSDFQDVKDQGNGTYHITCTISKEKVERALIRAGLDGIKDGDTLYFNAIFKIKAYTVVQGKQYYRLKDIKGAAGWRNPNDFNEHFDIGITFHSAKYPVTVEYKTTSGKMLQEKKIGEWKAGKEVSVVLDGEKSSGGKKYVLYESHCVDLSKPTRKKNIIMVSESDYGKGHTQKRRLKIGGMKITAKMKIKPDLPEEPTPEPNDPHSGKPPVPVEVIEKKIALDQVNCQAKIKAEKKGNEKYDVETAIPSGEKLYIEGKADAALLDYKFTRYEGSIVYHVNVTVDYILKWQAEEDGEIVWNYRTVNGDKTVYIERKYSYWTVDYFNYYTADNMKIENEALPYGKSVIAGVADEVGLEYRKTERTYPLIKTETIHMGNCIQRISGSSSSPSYIDYNGIAECVSSSIKTANDFLEFKGENIIDDEVCMETTEYPNLPEEPLEMAEFYQEGLKIPESKKNNEYLSKGQVYYKRRVSAIEKISSEEAENAAETILYTMEEINPVVVFTPVVCHGNITDQSYLCQSVSPNPAQCQLVLDTEFSVSASCYGMHLPYKGYGMRDYAGFCKNVEVCIPFDVYRGDTLCPAGTWRSISEMETCYLPIWVKEGDYHIVFRALAKNGNSGQAGMNEANLDPDYYAAIAEVPVQISGRMYGLKIYDITDYPLWKNVFRIENTEQLSGRAYYVGTRNQNGIDTGLKSLYTFPILEGSHPFYQKTGYLKTGYVIRCSLKTLGSFYHEEDCVEIEPQFYFVDENGEHRERVDIYYDESVSGRYQNLIRVGSERDRQNVRSLYLGARGLSVNRQEIEDTAFVRKMTGDTVMKQGVEWHGYQDLKISSALQTFAGIQHMMGRRKTVPSNIGKADLLRSKQNWYFEYYLPSSYHIVPYGYDVEAYAGQYPIDFKESFWKKEGFLIVNFHIYANRQQKRELSYINEDNEKNGYCNMWKTEGYFYKQTDKNGITFHLKDGDFAVFYYGKHQSSSAGVDYGAGGTH